MPDIGELEGVGISLPGSSSEDDGSLLDKKLARNNGEVGVGTGSFDPTPHGDGPCWAHLVADMASRTEAVASRKTTAARLGTPSPAENGASAVRTGVCPAAAWVASAARGVSASYRPVPSTKCGATSDAEESMLRLLRPMASRLAASLLKSGMAAAKRGLAISIGEWKRARSCSAIAALKKSDVLTRLPVSAHTP
eukprot:scaffold141981_cov31-Tisochrysis_lutea.AAC.3